MHKQLKAEKRKLRRQQRMEHAIDRTNLYQKIMENPNTQLFYKLINRNRQSCTNATNCIRVNDKHMYFTPAGVKYFAFFQ
jgi:predicted metal-dependent hydrolase